MIPITYIENGVQKEKRSVFHIVLYRLQDAQKLFMKSI